MKQKEEFVILKSDDEKVDAIWQKSNDAGSDALKEFKVDSNGILIKKSDYGNKNSDYGWGLARIISKKDGGTDDISNLKAVNYGESNYRKYRKFILWTSIYWGVMIIILLFLLFDLWNEGKFILWRLQINPQKFTGSNFRPIAYVMIGGALGAILYHIYKVIGYYVNREYNPKWLAKHLTAPFEGAILAFIVIAILKSGIGTLSGGTVSSENTTITNFFSFGLGGLIGYGLRHVVRWLQDITRAIFRSSTPKDAPDEKTEVESTESKKDLKKD